ncbi:cytochrome c biogenesis CcdA family protein [Cetobacterium sp.]|uniref:cytochrome c biogenesis CcdA family protein n=1 Tax=Cetobacterium sp. TaxID=2071632 RepID=UPI003AF1CBE1
MITNELFIGVVYFAGLLSFFSPCIFPLLPVYIGMLSRGGERSILKTLVFVLGLSMSFVLLGFGAGIIGEILMSDTFRIISGILVICFGIIQMDIIKIPLLERTKLMNLEVAEKDGFIGTFFLGFTFSLGWTPCVGPILTSILFISSGGGSPIYGAMMMFIYVLGLATPFVIFSYSYRYLEKKLIGIRKHLNLLKKLGGVLIVGMGILLLTDNLNLFL